MAIDLNGAATGLGYATNYLEEDPAVSISAPGVRVGTGSTTANSDAITVIRIELTGRAPGDGWVIQNLPTTVVVAATETGAALSPPLNLDALTSGVLFLRSVGAVTDLQWESAISAVRYQTNETIGRRCHDRLRNPAVRAASGGHHPRITLEAAHSQARNPNGTAERYTTNSLVLKANWTLFEGGGRTAQVAQVAYSVQGLVHQVEEARRESLMQFDQATVRYEDALAQHALATQHTGVSSEALRLARLAFEAGRRQAIDVADVIVEAARAADEAARRDAQRWIERDRLLATAGALLDQLGVVLAPN